MANNNFEIWFNRSMWQALGKRAQEYGRGYGGHFTYSFDMRTIDAIFHVAIQQCSEKLLETTQDGMKSKLALTLWNYNIDRAQSSSLTKAKRLKCVARCEFMIAKGFTHPNPDINLQERVKTMKVLIQNELTVR